MHKKFLQILIFIVGMTLTLGASPTIAMDNEETSLMNHSKKKSSAVHSSSKGKKGQQTGSSMKKKSSLPKDSSKNLKNPIVDKESESTRLKRNIKHIEPGCCQSIQTIRSNPRWKTWKLDEPLYNISDYTSGCGTCCAIFCCLFCCTPGEYGGCYFSENDLMCFDMSAYRYYKKITKKDLDVDGKVMTRRDALRVMDVMNRETLEYYSNTPEKRVDLYQPPMKVHLTPSPIYQFSSDSFTLGYQASYSSGGSVVNLGRTEEIKEYE